MDGLRRLPRFPCPSAPPPGPYGPVSRGPSGRGGPSGGRAPGPDGIRRLAPGPVVMAPPIPPHARGPRPRSSNPDPLGPAIGTRLNGYERIWGGEGGGRGGNGWMSEWIRMNMRSYECRNDGTRCGAGGKRGTPREPEGARPGGTVSCEAAARYSPTPSRVQYHRRAGP